MQRIVSVRLRKVGQILWFMPGDLKPISGDYVIVEGERGLDYGQVTGERLVSDGQAGKSLRRVVRLASASDISQIKDNERDAEKAFAMCLKKTGEHRLKMKLLAGEYSFDKTRLVFYFTADGRVDFRKLVKDLARLFRARIELRQIGVRDEAKFFGGFGCCGRELCCAKFIREFDPVTVRMAKDQNLPLNPSKISGLCGRLMCCLSYEHKAYRRLCRGMPIVGARINTSQGRGQVTSVNLLSRKAVVKTGDGRNITLTYSDNAARPSCRPTAKI
ncbi:MAG: stage 0 sporulation family protein [Candidatus Omnitrophota bacterium]